MRDAVTADPLLAYSPKEKSMVGIANRLPAKEELFDGPDRDPGVEKIEAGKFSPLLSAGLSSGDSKRKPKFGLAVIGELINTLWGRIKAGLLSEVTDVV
jgi:hypothetical protein